MKKYLRLFASVLLFFISISAFGQKFTNYPLPQQPDTLRILGIGNSFTDDGMMYLPELLDMANIDNVILGRLYIGGCSLERHCTEYEKESSAYVYYKSVDNKWSTVSKQASLVYGIEDEKWDIIVLQQSSPKSGIYDTFQPWLTHLVEIVRTHCSNAGACIAWQQTWAYSTNSTHPDFPRYEKNQSLMYKGIMSATESVLEETGIETIIPTGTAVQNMRATEFCDEKEFTRDGYHLSYGAGRYLGACTWFQALIAPCFKTTITGNPCTLSATEHELTPDLAKACQTAALRATLRPLSIWE